MATFTGTNGADTITPTTVSAGVIATAPFPGSDLDSLYGGLGNDLLDGGGGRDTVYGDSGDDTVFVEFGNDYAYGGPGTDTLNLTRITSDFVLDLETGQTNTSNQVLRYFENVLSGSGIDRLTGTGGANRIEGGAGNDTIAGGGGADSTYGGLGDDLILAHGADAILDGGDGIDTLDCTGVTADFWLDLNTGETAAPGQSATGFENLITGAGHDTLVGRVIPPESKGVHK